MKIILRQDYESLGKLGAVLEVKDGYARNFLIPRGLVYPATAKYERMLEADRRLHDKKKQHVANSAAELAARISGAELVTHRKAGEEGRLFGSVTSSDLAELLAAQGIELDRRKIILDEPIRLLGNYQVRVHLHEEIYAVMQVSVLKEE